METSPMALPSIHMNGTSREELQRLNNTAWAKLNEAITALREAAPHARDYYVQDSAAYGTATSEHRSRVLALVNVQEQLTTMAHHLSGTTTKGQVLS